MIDLHLHTTASDGELPPAALVARAAAAGIRTLSVTDHDTVAGLDEARRAADTQGLAFVDGIEITAVECERDVHVLGYFFDPRHPGLLDFLAAQRQDRVRRVREIGDRLAALGVAVDIDPLIHAGLERGRSVGRPHVAQALVAAGHVGTCDEAFDLYLDRSRAAFVPRRGAPVAEVVRLIARAGGMSSLAHPGTSRVDPLIPSFAHAGLDALEARHCDHDASTEARYRAIAARHRLAISGGSDFHGDAARGHCALGASTVPAADFAAFRRARR